MFLAGDGFSGDVGGATLFCAPLFLCPSVNFASFGKNHCLVSSSNQIMPRFSFTYLLIFFILKLKQSFGGTKLVNGFEKSKHLEKLKLFV